MTVTDTAPRIARPLSLHLEREVSRLVSEKALVIWLDAEGTYSGFVDDLRQSRRFGVPIVAFRGSWLQLLAEFDGYEDGHQPDPLVVHLPGFNRDTVRATPALELYRAGHRYERALPTLVREAADGVATPVQIDALLAESDLTFERAEAWLQALTGGARSDLERMLETTPLESLLEMLVRHPRALPVSGRDDLDALIESLARNTGLRLEFVRLVIGADRPSSVADVADVFAAWVLAVEFVNDLGQVPRLPELVAVRSLPDPIRRRCLALTQTLRERLPDEYERLADRTESILAPDLDHMTPANLGKVDTFRREDAILLGAAASALACGEHERAHQWAVQRTSSSFWLARDIPRRLAWALVLQGADLGRRIAGATPPLDGVTDLRGAVERYTTALHEVDRAHRCFEQLRLKTLSAQLPHFTELLHAADALRVAYRAWADRLARDFNAICAAGSFVPPPDLQQRTLYEEVVHRRLCELRPPASLALFMVDALRFEMAAALAESMAGDGVKVKLCGRLAELPTITAVGMNALAPVAGPDGRLTLAREGFGGFRCGEFTVRDPESRARAMYDRSVERRDFWKPMPLADVCSRTPDELKNALKKRRLIIVHSKEIDDAGEANVGVASFETWLSQLETAWRHLKAAGVTEFVFTADHGFLLQDQTTRVIPYGLRRDAERRYIARPAYERHDGLQTVTMVSLGYSGAEGCLLFPDDTGVFESSASGGSFVHGGNSMQERVIPVLTVSLARKDVSLKGQFSIDARAESEVLGHSRVRVAVSVISDTEQLTLLSCPTVNLSLRADLEGVRLVVKEAHGAGQLVNQTLVLPTNGEPTEVLFALEGHADGRARVEVVGADEAHDVEPCRVEAFFTVRRAFTAEASAHADEGTWLDALPQEVAAVFAHLQVHGSLTEEELIMRLGGARQARRFAASFDGYLQYVPFGVRVEPVATGKRYVRTSTALEKEASTP